MGCVVTLPDQRLYQPAVVISSLVQLIQTPQYSALAFPQCTMLSQRKVLLLCIAQTKRGQVQVYFEVLFKRMTQLNAPCVLLERFIINIHLSL